MHIFRFDFSTPNTTNTLFQYKHIYIRKHFPCLLQFLQTRTAEVSKCTLYTYKLSIPILSHICIIIFCFAISLEFFDRKFSVQYLLVAPLSVLHLDVAASQPTDQATFLHPYQIRFIRSIFFFADYEQTCRRSEGSQFEKEEGAEHASLKCTMYMFLTLHMNDCCTDPTYDVRQMQSVSNAAD